MGLNDAVLRAFDSAWHDERDLPENWMSHAGVLEIKVRIKEVIRSDFGAEQCFGLKDPRIAVLLPLYLEILRELSVLAHLVVCQRPDAEVAASHQARWNPEIHGAYSAERMRRLIRTYKRCIAEFTKGREIVVVQFPQLCEDPVTAVRNLSASLSVPLRPIASAESELNSFLDPNLRHHRLI